MKRPSVSMVSEQAPSWKTTSIDPEKSPASIRLRNSSLSRKSEISQAAIFRNLSLRCRSSTARIRVSPRAFSARTRFEPMNPAAPVTTKYIPCFSRLPLRFHRRPSYRIVLQAKALELRRIVEIASVENRRRLEPGTDRLKVRAAKLLPFGDDRKSVRTLERGERGIRVADAREPRERAPGRRHCYRVVGADRRAVREELLDQDPAWGLSHVVRIRLERAAPDGDATAGELAVESRQDFSREHPFLSRVHLLHRLENRERAAGLFGRSDQGLDVLRKAGAAVAGPRVEEVIADPRVRAHAFAHLLDVGAETLGEIGEFVHERDAGRKHGVRRVFGELGGAHVHQQKALVVALERCVERAHDLYR